MDIFDKINELYDKRRQVELGGGDARIERQHEKGKMTARERIDYLLDNETFVELNPFIEHRGSDFGMDSATAKGEGVVTGYGKIYGKPVYLFAQDFTVYGGALGEMHGKKIAAVMRSEEHTSELQSRGHLVCRLLLETKNTNHYIDKD